ncbi:MAG: FKBP-type peptidyl-prolyl cis-trans isomerase [bacterium]|nr:FKBP-type peptidyl-prolyl cis-trans isomerase [bacterium]
MEDRKGKYASFLFKGSLAEDGSVFDDCQGEPLTVRLGRHHVMRPMEDALMEMEIGEERTLEIPAALAYGEYNEDAVQRVPTYKIPNGDKIPVGEMVSWKSPKREMPVPAKVVSVINQIITLDFNHPLAGKDLVYWIKLLDISDNGEFSSDS